MMMLLALQGHAPVLNNPPQAEDADILEEPGASGADDVAPTVDVGAVLLETGDSEDSSPFRVKWLRPLGAEDLDASSNAVLPAAPSAEPSPSAAAPKRVRLGRLGCPRTACGG